MFEEEKPMDPETRALLILVAMLCTTAVLGFAANVGAERAKHEHKTAVAQMTHELVMSGCQKETDR